MRTALLATLAGIASALYGAKDGVVELTDANFNSKVLKDEGIWLVEVYAPWCGHCKSLAPDWSKAAKALKGIVNVGALDGTAHEQTAQKLQVKGFPTIFLYTAGKAQPYNGARDAKSIVDAALAAASSAARARLSGKASGGSAGGSGAGSGKKASGGGKKGGASASEPGGGKGVATLTDDEFESTVLDSEEAWMVEFYAPWCGHCKSLAPEWAEAAAQTEGSGVRFGAVDATVHQSWASKFGVKGYPTIISFAGGKKTAKSAKPYNGPRTASDLVTFAQGLAESAGPVKAALTQLTSPAAWAEACGGKRICMAAVLPHIADDGAAKRSARLEALAEAAGAVGKRNLFRWVWLEAGSQPSLEGLLNVGVTPALYAVSDDKKMFTPLRGAMDAAHVKAFALGLTAGRAEGATPFPAGTASAGAGLVTVPAWDGKDAAVEVAEEFSLDEL